MNIEDGRRRAVIERVSPEIDAGRFPIKRVLGEAVRVEADIFADGHDTLCAVLKFRHGAALGWSEIRMEPLVSDRWQGSFLVTALGHYLYTIEAWADHFATWQKDLEKKYRAGQEIAVELSAGVPFLQAALRRAKDRDAQDLRAAANTLAPDTQVPNAAKVAVALNPHLAELVNRNSERQQVVSYGRELRVVVDPVRARFSAWFEMFPRSAAPEAGRHGTFRECEIWMPRIASMGFDVLYLPPVHPIGRSFRKGKNNALFGSVEDPGSPWAIGAEEGGHKAAHPQLGNIEDFQRLVHTARDLGIELALDIALQCSPDHPYVRQHPQWFRRRADGSIQYAENPPKKYQDIYPLDFESEDWQALWVELKSIFEFWIDQGVRVFRVDNPHTKPFAFWEWCLAELKGAHPELIFLSEAFTRPKVMSCLAKLGFSQSYTYFPWRNTKHELERYLTDLTQTEVREYFRPCHWLNTPDILTQYLQYGGPPAFMARFILAATLGASYGLYGPPFIAGENLPREPGSEEYLNSEKYEIRHWNLDTAGPMSSLITKVNQVRRENLALQRNDTLRFHPVDNDQLIAYTKTSDPPDDIILTIVNLDPHHAQRGWVTLPIDEWGLGPNTSYQFHELLTEARFLWSGSRNFVELDPQFVPAHILRLRRYLRTEQDFDYFL